MSARNDFLSALKALLPPASDGTVAVVRAGELVTVSLTLPGREKPITTATVRAPKKGDAAQRDLFEARVPAESANTDAPAPAPAPEPPAAPAEQLAPVDVPAVALPPRELSVGAGVHSDGSTWKVIEIEGDRVSLVLDIGHAHHPEHLVLPRSAITLNSADVWGFEQSPAWGDASHDEDGHITGAGLLAEADSLIRTLATGGIEALARSVETPAEHPADTCEVSGGHPAGVSQTPERVDAAPEGKPWTLFSVEVSDREDEPRSWALRKGLAWCCGGFLIWGIEGGASKRGKHRMVAIVPSERAHELLDLVDDASMVVSMHDLHYGDTLLRVGSFVRREDGWRWPVSAIDRTTRMVLLERNGATVSVELGAIETTSDGTGDFEIVSTKRRDTKPEKPAQKPSKRSSAPKAKAPSVPAGSVELRVDATVYAKHRKGLLDLAKQPLGGCWKVAGKTASVIVSAGTRSAIRVLSYCNHAGIKCEIEGAPIDVANAMGPNAPTEEESAPEVATEAPAPITSKVITDDGFELFKVGDRPRWKLYAKKGRYSILRHWIDGRVELVATVATEAEARAHDPWSYHVPGVDDAVICGSDGGLVSGGSRGHDAYVVPGRWTSVASSKGGYFRWVGDDETEARAAFERLRAIPGVILITLVDPAGKNRDERDGPAHLRSVADDDARDRAAQLPRAVLGELKIDQAVRVASGSAGINGVPVSLAGETCVVVKIGPKKVTVYCRKLARSYAVPADSLEVLPVAEGGVAP